MAQPCTHEDKYQPRAYKGHLYTRGRSCPHVYSGFRWVPNANAVLSGIWALERGSQYIKINPEITSECHLFTKTSHQDIHFTCQVNIKMVMI